MNKLRFSQLCIFTKTSSFHPKSAFLTTPDIHLITLLAWPWNITVRKKKKEGGNKEERNHIHLAIPHQNLEKALFQAGKEKYEMQQICPGIYVV